MEAQMLRTHASMNNLAVSISWKRNKKDLGLQRETLLRNPIPFP